MFKSMLVGAFVIMAAAFAWLGGPLQALDMALNEKVAQSEAEAYAVSADMSAQFVEGNNVEGDFHLFVKVTKENADKLHALYRAARHLPARLTDDAKVIVGLVSRGTWCGPKISKGTVVSARSPSGKSIDLVIGEIAKNQKDVYFPCGTFVRSIERTVLQLDIPSW